ncbi:hypothetical protein BOTU111921_22950 [Bordetella tumbae]
MRPLSTSELSAVYGAELQQYFQHPSASGSDMYLDFVNEPNGSSTIFLLSSSGQAVWSYNTGVGLACFMTTTGIGITVTGLSGNSLLGSAAAALVGVGCKDLGSKASPRIDNPREICP